MVDKIILFVKSLDGRDLGVEELGDEDSALWDQDDEALQEAHRSRWKKQVRDEVQGAADAIAIMNSSGEPLVLGRLQPGNEWEWLDIAPDLRAHFADLFSEG